eukprot:SAG31_NODE_287_length_18430_cov_8.127544_21_plen_69_part_00
MIVNAGVSARLRLGRIALAKTGNKSADDDKHRLRFLHKVLGLEATAASTGGLVVRCFANTFFFCAVNN